MFTLGLDFGTNSVRALVVRCSDGAEFGSGSSTIPPERRASCLIRTMVTSPGNIPATICSASRKSIKGALAEAATKPGFSAAQIVGIGVDTTGSSPLPVDEKNRPLALEREMEGTISRRNAGCGRTIPSWREAARITESQREDPAAIHRQVRRTPIPRNGSGPRSGIASTSRRLCSRRRIRGSRSLTGSPPCSPASPIRGQSSAASAPPATRRSIRDEWGGLPDKEFLAMLDPRLAALRDRLYERAYDANEPAGVALRRMGRQTRPSRGDSDRDRRIRRPLRRDRLRRARGHAGQGDRHLDLRYLRRLRRQAGRRHSRRLRHRRRRGPARLLRHRGRASRRSATFSNGGSKASAAATPRSTPRSPPKRPSRSRAKPACWRSTGTTATGPSSSISCYPG